MRKKSDLRPVQQEAITHLYERDKSLLFCRPGGGKTVIYETAISELMDEGVVKRVLGTAPLRVAELVWSQEHTQWEHLKHLDVGIATGTQEERDAVVSGKHQIVVTNHENFLDVLFFCQEQGITFDALFIDELSKFKGPTGARWQPLLKMSKNLVHRVGLTGSPAANGIEDLFGQVRVIDMGATLGRSWGRWRNENMMLTNDGPIQLWAPRSDTFGKLMHAIEPMTYVLSPEDWKPPPIKHIPVPVELPAEIRLLYEELEEKQLLQMGDDLLMPGGKAQVQAKLQQLCAGFYYITKDGERSGRRLHHFRLDAIEDVVSMQDGPVAIIYDYKEQLAELRRRYPKAPVLGQGTTRKQAADAYRRWNDGELSEILMHPASAGHGLNMQHGGHRVAWCSLPWSLDFYEQVVLRFAREGQTAAATLSWETCAKDTVEERVRDTLITKAFTQDAVFNYPRR